MIGWKSSQPYNVMTATMRRYGVSSTDSCSFETGTGLKILDYERAIGSMISEWNRGVRDKLSGGKRLRRKQGDPSVCDYLRSALQNVT